MAIAAVSTVADPYATLNQSTASQASENEASADRFLKLLVTQMQNQDPLNPMDNAQITSQMAQINTVSGIEKLNTTVKGLNGQFLQLQAVSGAALVGRVVSVAGDRMVVENGIGAGGFELSGTAGQVKVEVLDPSGRVVGNLDLGSLPAGRHAFVWDASALADGADHRFRVIASNGTIAATSTPLMFDRVQAVSTSSTGLVLDTQYNGSVAYSDVKAVN